MRGSRLTLILTVTTLLVTGCSTSASDTGAGPVDAIRQHPYGDPPAAPSGPLDPAVRADLDLVFGSLEADFDTDALARLGRSGDPRIAWLFVDLLRFLRPGSELSTAVVDAWASVTGSPAESPHSPWDGAANRLIAWDTPAPPDYVRWKRQVYELVEPGWAPFFDDADALIDWRWVTWGGVLIDDRPLDQTDFPCWEGCIPALNDPALTDASEGGWYSDDRVVFGIVIGDEAVAFPKNVMEVHEMVNATIGGRRVGMPYCTLCGSAQAYFTDDITEGVDLGEHHTYELRTSGLLSRSNKVMYDFHTGSVSDTFTGEAVSGPLREAGVTLEQLTVHVATWGAWKEAHPSTSIVARDGGIGRIYSDDPLRGRDDDGPIFPIGDVDPRLGVQEPIVGVLLEDGTAIAFPAAEAASILAEGGVVEEGGVSLTTDGAGFTARTSAGEPLAAHQAFWFAWSQFHPNTRLWVP